MNFDTLLVGSVPLMVVVFGLVEFIKSFGLKGNILTIISMALGIAFGVGYRISSDGVPTGFTAWFAVILFGLLIGLVASGFYKFANSQKTKDLDINASKSGAKDDQEKI